LLLTKECIQQAKIILNQCQVQNDFIVLCPGAIGHGIGKKSKIWPYWRTLANTLAKDGQQLIACPAPYELQRFKHIFSDTVTIIPNLNISLYAALMKQARQVIANDSGPMHLAASVQAPVLGIFGQTSPERCRPWGGTYIGALNAWPSCADVLKTLGF
ncbi:MAG TPA: glycosyltransferase family 9 protein, partial [Legionellaceae bacterium]|nr:glycosyltransferase family 9 protein [Legionellaceae bacterium]